MTQTIEPKLTPLQRAILLVKHEAPEHTALIKMLEALMPLEKEDRKEFFKAGEKYGKGLVLEYYTDEEHDDPDFDTLINQYNKK